MASTSIDMYVDEAYLIALINGEPIPISDEKFAEELSLQEALFSQSQSTLPTNHHHYHNQQVPLIPKTEEKNREIGESSRSKLIFCGICMEAKHDPEMFKGLSECNHVYCMDCIVKYVGSKIKENVTSIECPDPTCKRVIKPEFCSAILPKEVFGRWENALCESLVLGYQKFYCPFKDCSVLLVDDGGEEVRQSVCPNCHRMFCARCRVGWHVGVTCDEFMKLDANESGMDDVMVMKLAKDKEWKRCSNCKFYVEKTEGCNHMKCRCDYEFCYKCEGKWSSSHGC